MAWPEVEYEEGEGVPVGLWQVSHRLQQGRLTIRLVRAARGLYSIITILYSLKCYGNQCCGSVMFIPDPDFYPSRIPDPKIATKERGENLSDFFLYPQISQN